VQEVIQLERSLAGLEGELAVERDSRDVRLEAAIKALSTEALDANSARFLELAETHLSGQVRPLKESLDRMDQQLQSVERVRQESYGALRTQVATLSERAGSLTNALRTPHVRGRWGEAQLRNVVEYAGMIEYCDYVSQATTSTDDGTLRPDLVVRLAGERSVVVDAKVPLDAFLDATAADADQRDAHLARHARQLRVHVELLGSKRYWRSLPETPEFVVLFLPAESFLSAALEADASLIEYAADRGVVLASPTTLIALLRTVAHGWRHEALADRAREIHRVGRDLHERIGTMSGHLGKLGRSLEGAVAAYNQAVGSWESRVLVGARRFEELDATDDRLESVRVVGSTVRPAGSVHPLPRRAASGDETPAHTVAP